MKDIPLEVWQDVAIVVSIFTSVWIAIWVYAIIRDRKEKGKLQDTKIQEDKTQKAKMLPLYKPRTWHIENTEEDMETIPTKEKEEKRKKAKALEFHEEPPNDSIPCLLLQRSDLHERHSDLFIDEVKLEHFSKLANNKLANCKAAVFKQGEQMRILLPEDHSQFKLFTRDADVYLMKK